nr:MAG: hypothetical protein [Totiviridae sp.]
MTRPQATMTTRPVRGARAPTSLYMRPSSPRPRRPPATCLMQRHSLACGRLMTPARRPGGVRQRVEAPPPHYEARQPWRTSGLQVLSPRSPRLTRDPRRLRPRAPLPRLPQLGPVRKWPVGWPVPMPPRRPPHFYRPWDRCGLWVSVPPPEIRAPKPRARWSGDPR